MSYDDLTDPVVEACRAVLTRAVNEVLGGSLGDDHPAIRSTSGYPTPLDGVEGLKLPAMFVYVEKEDPASARHAFHDDDVRLSVVFEYLGPATPIAKLGTRWPLLRAVWRETKIAIDAGLLAGEDVFTPIGVIQARALDASVQYRFATDGENAYPAFAGRFPILWRDPTDVTASLSLLKLFVDINRVNPTDPHPSVQVIQNA